MKTYNQVMLYFWLFMGTAAEIYGIYIAVEIDFNEALPFMLFGGMALILSCNINITRSRTGTAFLTRTLIILKITWVGSNILDWGKMEFITIAGNMVGHIRGALSFALLMPIVQISEAQWHQRNPENLPSQRGFWRWSDYQHKECFALPYWTSSPWP